MFFLILLPLLVVPAQASSQASAQVRGLVAATQGTVFAEALPEKSLAASTPIWTPLHDGEAFFVAPKAEMLILCADGACHRLTEPFVVSPEICADESAVSCQLSSGNLPLGTSSPTTAGRRILDRWVAAQGDWQLLGQARDPGERWGHDPVLISPRCPESGSDRGCEQWQREPEELIFLAVRNASRYRFRLTGPGRWEDLILAPSEVDRCEPWPAFADQSVCRHPWPESWRLPNQGRPVRLALEVEVRGYVRRTETQQRLQLLPPPRRAELAKALGLLSGSANDLVRILVHLRHGADASLLPWLAEASEVSPALELRLAQLYLQSGLLRPAYFHFSRLAERQGLEPRLVAEARIGQAHASHLLGRPDDALRQLDFATHELNRLGVETRSRAIANLRHRIDAVLSQD